jgi:hypothetical protein
VILTGIRLANFKAFGASQRVPLRPITLVFGANSAGKSSLIHALALAHHAVGTGDLDTRRTEIGGEAIDLGGFRQYVHRRERERQVELGFELDPGRLGGRVAEFLRPARAMLVEVAVGAGFASEQRTLEGNLPRELDRAGGVCLERFALVVDGAPLLSMTARPGGALRLDRLDHHHSVFREVLRGIVTLATTTQQLREDDFEGLGEVLDALIPGVIARAQGLFPRVEEDAEASGVEASPAFLTVSRGRRREDLARAARLFLPRALRDLIEGVASGIEEEIRRLRYLGPLRSYPPRHLAFSQYHDPNWFAGGGYAWDVVRTREDIRRRVNEWLGDAARLKTPYELVVRDLLPAGAVAAELPPKLARALHDLAISLLERLHGEAEPDLATLAREVAARSAETGSEEPGETIPEVEEIVTATTDSEALVEQWVRELVEARGEALQDLVLIDKRTGTPVSHRDVGIGVSQVLPVLVSAYASNGLFVAIEQPEIHLHPALQAELGDVFLQSALGGQNNSFLIETHSEHVILRILRRVRETADLELPEGLPRVRPEDISVVYVQPGREGAEVIHLPVTADGEFEHPWPEGFFAERAKELF